MKQIYAHRPRRRPRCLELVNFALAMGMLMACGGAPRGLVFDPSPHHAWSVAVPTTTDAMRAWLDAPEQGAVARVAQSIAHEMLGETESAYQALVDDQAWLDPRDHWLRMVRLIQLSEAVGDWGERTETWLEAHPTTDDPLGRIAHAMVWSRVLWSRGDRPDFGSDAGVGRPTPAAWRCAGPFETHVVMSADSRLLPETSRQLEDAYSLPGRELATRFVPATGGDVQVPWRESGVFFCEAYLTLGAEDDVWVAVHAAPPSRVWIGDEVVVDATFGDIDSAWMHAGRARLSAGVHRVLVRHDGQPFRLVVVPDSAPAAGFSHLQPQGVDAGFVVASPGQSAPVSHARRADDSELAAGAWLSATLLSQFSSDRALGARATRAMQALDDPISRVAQSLLAATDATMPSSMRNEWASRHLERVLEMLPEADGVRVALAYRRFENGQTRAASELLAPALTRSPDDWLVARLRAEILEDEGFDALAETSWRRVATLRPDDCDAVARVVDAMQRRAMTVDPEAIPPGWLRCAAAQIAVAQSYDLPRGDLSSARARVERALELAPERDVVHEFRIDLAVAANDALAISGALEDVQRWRLEPIQTLGYRFDLALAGIHEDSAAADAYRAGLTTQVQSYAQLAMIDADSVFSDLRLDGLAAAVAYFEEPTDYQTEAVLILDYTVVYLFEDLSGLRLTHQVAQLRTRDALAYYGEVGVPDLATVLTARTIKPDGSVLWAENIPGKDAISMPALEIGDVMEMEWIEPIYPSRPSGPSVRLDRFYFAVPDLALHRSIAAFEAPGPIADALQFDVRNFDGTRDVSVNGDRVRTTFTALNVAAVDFEPYAIPADEWLPSVRVGYGVNWDTITTAYAERVERSSQMTDEMRDYLAELVPRGGHEDRIRTIFRHAVDGYIDYGGFFSRPAAWMYAEGEGQRAPLLLAWLRAAGYEPEVAFIRPREQDQSSSSLPDDLVFDLTAIVVRVGRHEFWLEPDFDDYPFNFLRPEAQGQDALIISGPRRGTFVTTPVWPDAVNVQRIDVDILLNEDGDAVVHVVERSPLRSASGLRSYLRFVEDRSRLGEELERSLVRSFGQTEVFEVEVIGEEDYDAPLEIAYRFHAPGLAERHADGSLEVDSEFFERNIAATYATRATRATTMYMGANLDEEVVIRIRGPEGMMVVDVPESTSASWRDNWVEREARRSGASVVLTRRLRVPQQRVEPEAYAELIAFVQGVASGSRVRVRFSR